MGEAMKSVHLLKKLRNMSAEELERETAELRQKVWAQGIQQATGQLQDPHKVKETKRDLARVLTVKRELQAGRGR
jgi:large subunit ribosomal protein L29